MTSRKQFLTDLLITAIEHGGYGFPEILEYEPDAETPYAVITDRYDEPGDPDALPQTRVTTATMVKGLNKIRKTENPSEWVRDLIKADRTNGDDGDYDVIGALAVLEYALFGEIRYA